MLDSIKRSYGDIGVESKIVLAPFFIFLILFSLGGCAKKEPGVKPPFNIYPYEFYEKFNLRTIISSYDGYLKYYCATYPKDFFNPNQVRMPNMERLIAENSKRVLIFDLYSQDKVIITDTLKDGSYRSKYIYKIYYNEKHDDFRTDRFFIKKPLNCKKYIIKDTNLSK